MSEPFPSISNVYALVLQEGFMNIGHGSTFTLRLDLVSMYANTKGNSSNKGGNKKDRPLCTHCNMLGHTMDKCYKLHGYPPRYKHKGKSNVNANQCPISKAQCEQLLALFNTRVDFGDNHRAASVSTSGGVSSLFSGAFGVSAIAGVASKSSLPLANGLAHWSTLGLGRECNGLYLLDESKSTSPSISARLYVHKIPSHVWHSRLGHLSNAKLALMKNNGVPLFTSVETFTFEICPLAKQKRLSFNKSSHISNNCFDLTHCDLWGLFSMSTIDNCKYFLTIVDDCSRCTWVYLLKHKSQTQLTLEQFCTMVETQFSKKIRAIWSDNGTGFIMKDFFAKKWILHQLSCVETPQQNAVVERKHQHILNVARALMFQSNLPLHLWGHSILAAVYLINRIPTSALSHQTPFKILFGHVSSYSHLKVFGCLCYKVLDLSSHNVFISRDVIFDEDSFPFATFFSNVADPFASSSEVDVAPFSSVGNDAFVTPISIIEVANSPTVSIHSSPTPSSFVPFNSNVAISLPLLPNGSFPSDQQLLTTDVSVSSSQSPTPVPSAPSVPLRKSTRDTRPPAYLKDYACIFVTPSAPYDLAQSLTYSHLEPCYQSYLLTVNSCPQEP
ncbi:uncharacterized protein LOC142608926 [Castanea sativa]|uniref:uncharacterized protein LOC142608926 n=1 Tax=Castanea sativa TaxID=21020 RepID=UPI003F649647